MAFKKWWLVVNAAVTVPVAALTWFASGQAAVQKVAVLQTHLSVLGDETKRLRDDLAQAKLQNTSAEADSRSAKDSLQMCREHSLKFEQSAGTVPALASQLQTCSALVATHRGDDVLAAQLSELRNEERLINAHLADMSSSDIFVHADGDKGEWTARRELVNKRINLLLGAQQCGVRPEASLGSTPAG